jgi:endo-1,4-beta-xylanase
VLAAAAGAALLTANRPSRGAPGPVAAEPLKVRAARRGLFFGCGVSLPDIQNDPEYQSAVVTECAEIVPTVEMKWGVLEKREGSYDFSAADSLLAFALNNGMKIRGHTAVWYRNIPAWAPAALTGPSGSAVYEQHIRTVLGHFGGQLASWDVVNEAIWTPDGLPGSLRRCVFEQAFGADYIPTAFSIARSVLPKTPLYYNEFGLEYDDQLHTLKRAATLQLLSELKSKGLVDGLGIQSHLHVGWGFDAPVFRRFLADVAALGLEILLTEFDVNDAKAPADEAIRDQMVADHARRYLETALDETAVKGLICWGLSDRYSWLNAPPFNRADGLASRGQPLDASLRRKPLWNTLAAVLDGAPRRAVQRHDAAPISRLVGNVSRPGVP